MMTTVYVEGAERMLIHARLGGQSLEVYFADGCQGEIPLDELALAERPVGLALQSPYAVELKLADGTAEEFPWDYLRHFIDPAHRRKEKTHSRRAQRRLGERLLRLRTRAKLSQQALAERSGVGRVTIARIELGRQSPKYETLLALAKGLGMGIERLLLD